MAGSIINLTETMTSFMELYKQLNTQASNTVGIDVHWMRALPHADSEDVIFHEYTLHDVECPKEVRVVATNSSYNPGNFSIDYFGINYEAPFEIEIDKVTWDKVYGDGVMPQKNDIVYVGLFNCLYEVASSTIVYGFAEQETGFKVQLTKWTPRANVRLNQDVESTIEDLTVGEQELFGEQISADVADIVDSEETSQYLNTSVQEHDPYKKENDVHSIVIADIYSGADLNTVARSYYDMSIAGFATIYAGGDTVTASDRRFFSCWLRLKGVARQTKAVGALISEGGKYYIDGNRISGLSDGGDVIINRGSQLTLHAVTNQVAVINGVPRYMVTFNNTEYRAAVKRITNWNANLMMTVGTDADTRAVFLGRTDGECNFGITFVNPSTLLVRFGGKERKVNIPAVTEDRWIALTCNLGKESDISVWEQGAEGAELVSKTDLGDMGGEFSIGEFYIPQGNIDITNIRYYRTRKPVGDEAALKDISSMLMRNNSDAIVADNAAVPNKSPYIAEQR